jgi:hypothetical protein
METRFLVSKSRTLASRIFMDAGPIRIILIVALALSVLLPAAMLAGDDDGGGAFLPATVRVVSTVPATGDGNPYGVAFVPKKFPAGGGVNPGDILVSNFNNGANAQGTGTTIMRIQGTGPATVFFQGAGKLGLTTALTVLKAGFVLVGNFPSPDLSGKCTTAEPGSILVVNKFGKQLFGAAGAITDPSINGPWDSAQIDDGDTAKLFVANGRTGTVVRLDLIVTAAGVTLKKATTIASGYLHMCDPVTFVDAPTGLVYDPDSDRLFVASSADNAVFEVFDAKDRTTDGGTGLVIYKDDVHLHGPLGMTVAPNGHLLVSNNDAINVDPNNPSVIVEFTTKGKFVRQMSVDQAGGGAFGLNISRSGSTSTYAFVDDNVNALYIWTLKSEE